MGLIKAFFHRNTFDKASFLAKDLYTYAPAGLFAWLDTNSVLQWLAENPVQAFILLLIFAAALLYRQRTAEYTPPLSFKPNLKRKDRTTFDDIAGLEAEKRELGEIVDYLKDPKKFARMGARLPGGVLLTGPPGTGKTLLARAVAGEAGVPFFSAGGSEFVEMLAGVGAARVRALFRQARKNAPSIVFIDEIDALGKRREAGEHSGGEREQTLNQLLMELDGFDPRRGVVVLAATNRPDILDPALLRPGRFDRQITVGLPGEKEREEILKLYAANKPFSRSVSFKTAARLTQGFTGAELENLVNEAALLTVRRNKTKIGRAELEEALDRALAGIGNTGDVYDEEVAAVHEAGHALVGYMLLGKDVLHKISIIPRGCSAGQTVFLNSNESFTTASLILARISTILGGRAAEEEIFGEAGTGCREDLQQATMLARQMVFELGMGLKTGLTVLKCVYGCVPGRENQMSEKALEAAEEEVRRILDHCYRQAQKEVSESIIALYDLSAALKLKKTLYANEIAQLIEGVAVC